MDVTVSSLIKKLGKPLPITAVGKPITENSRADLEELLDIIHDCGDETGWEGWEDTLMEEILEEFTEHRVSVFAQGTYVKVSVHGDRLNTVVTLDLIEEK